MPAFVKFVNGKLYGGGRALSTDLGTTEVLSSGTTVSTLGRTLGKLRAGQNIKVGFGIDSIMAGGTADTPGTDDCASVVCSTLASRFGVTITKANRAQSGRNIQSWQIDGYWALLLADDPDVYVICPGHNDIDSDSATPGTGYPKAASMGGIEYLIRTIQATKPGKDIILMSENPYGVASTSLNTLLDAYNQSLRALAAYYGVQYVDGNAAFSRPADALLSDGAHPNSAGHALLANALLAVFPLTGDGSFQPLAPPVSSLYSASRYDRQGWANLNVSSTTALTERFKVSGAGWSGASGDSPYVTAGVGDLLEVQWLGSECALELDTGTGSAVVNVYIDGILTYSNLALTGYSTGARRIPITGLNAGHHVCSVVVVSGTLTCRGVDILKGPAEWIDAASTRITYTGTWTQDTLSSHFGGNRAMSATIGDTLAFEFVGTAFAVNITRQTTAQPITPTVDGVALSSVALGGATVSGPASVLVASGLEFGRHTVSIAHTAATNIRYGGISAWDERRIERPRRQSGIAKVGEAVVYGTPFAGRPVVRTWPLSTDTGDVRPTSGTTTGFTLSGTASELALWEAEGGLVAY